jgi:YD repeat-containing protein
MLTSQTMPENGTVSYTYNADASIATVTDAKNQQKRFSYDPYGRVIQIARGTLSGATFTEDTTQRTTFTYDGSNGGFSTNTSGRLSQVNYSGPHGLQFSELYSYHAAGATTAKRMSVSGTVLGTNTANFEAAYSYDTLGDATSVQYPFAQWSNGVAATAGPQCTYGYDAMNRLSALTGPGNQSLVSSVTYNPANQILQLNAGAFSETRTYNANLQLTELVSGSYHYKYNYSATQNNGRIISMQDVISGETVTYIYDSLNRLAQASATGDPTGAWSQQFAYDGFGNLTQKTGANAPNNAFLATNPLTNRLTRTEPVTTTTAI